MFAEIVLTMDSCYLVFASKFNENELSENSKTIIFCPQLDRMTQPCQLSPAWESPMHRRRIQTEEKAKVTAAGGQN